MRSLYWAHATVVVPPFEQRTQVALLVPCTYDCDVVSAKYLHGLEHGEIPLELLFSGSVFYPDDEGTLKTARVSWELETQYRLPVRVWRDLMDHYFPGSAWLRVRRDVFDRLHALKSARGHATWEQTLDALLRQAESETK